MSGVLLLLVVVVLLAAVTRRDSRTLCCPHHTPATGFPNTSHHSHNLQLLITCNLQLLTTLTAYNFSLLTTSHNLQLVLAYNFSLLTISNKFLLLTTSHSFTDFTTFRLQLTTCLQLPMTNDFI